jgi:hypothetical protein
MKLSASRILLVTISLVALAGVATAGEVSTGIPSGLIGSVLAVLLVLILSRLKATPA